MPASSPTYFSHWGTALSIRDSFLTKHFQSRQIRTSGHLQDRSGPNSTPRWRCQSHFRVHTPGSVFSLQRSTAGRGAGREDVQEVRRRRRVLPSTARKEDGDVDLILVDTHQASSLKSSQTNRISSDQSRASAPYRTSVRSSVVTLVRARQCCAMQDVKPCWPHSKSFQGKGRSVSSTILNTISNTT